MPRLPAAVRRPSIMSQKPGQAPQQPPAPRAARGRSGRTINRVTCVVCGTAHTSRQWLASQSFPLDNFDAIGMVQDVGNFEVLDRFDMGHDDDGLYGLQAARLLAVLRPAINAGFFSRQQVFDAMDRQTGGERENQSRPVQGPPSPPKAPTGPKPTKQPAKAPAEAPGVSPFEFPEEATKSNARRVVQRLHDLSELDQERRDVFDALEEVREGLEDWGEALETTIKELESRAGPPSSRLDRLIETRNLVNEAVRSIEQDDLKSVVASLVEAFDL